MGENATVSQHKYLMWFSLQKHIPLVHSGPSCVCTIRQALSLCNKYLHSTMAQTFLCLALYEGAISSHQTSRRHLLAEQARTYTLAFSWDPSLVESIFSQKENNRENYGRMMILSNISDHFGSTNSSLSMCHTPGRV